MTCSTGAHRLRRGPVNTRRLFLSGLVAAVTPLWERCAGADQHGGSVVGPYPPQDNRPEQPTPSGPTIPHPDKKELAQNQEKIREEVDRLFELATDLKAEVTRTDASLVLSATAVKKAHEIEKLAKDIKSRSKT